MHTRRAQKLLYNLKALQYTPSAELLTYKTGFSSFKINVNFFEFSVDKIRKWWYSIKAVAREQNKLKETTQKNKKRC